MKIQSFTSSVRKTEVIKPIEPIEDIYQKLMDAISEYNYSGAMKL